MIESNLTDEQARDALEKAWYGEGGKHAAAIAAGLEERRTYHSDCQTDGGGWVLVRLPLDWIRSNEAGDLYDGTVNRERAQRYAASPIAPGDPIEAPLRLMFGPRSIRNGHDTAAVFDGGHRISAARMRGDSSILSLMPRTQFELLAQVREQCAMADSDSDSHEQDNPVPAHRPA